MNKEILYEILNSESEMLSLAEIEGILNEELDKSPDEMDTDLVDLCLDALEHADDEKLNTVRKKRKFSLGKILAAAVIFVLLLAVSVSVGAKFVNIDAPEDTVKFNGDSYKVKNEDIIFDLAGSAKRDGIENIILPSMFFEPDIKISNYSVDKSSEASIIMFDFSYQDIEGNVSFNDSMAHGLPKVDSKFSAQFENIKKFDIDGISVIVFNYDNESKISYTVDKVTYDINLNCDFKTACKIVENF